MQHWLVQGDAQAYSGSKDITICEPVVDHQYDDAGRLLKNGVTITPPQRQWELNDDTGRTVATEASDNATV